MPAKLGNTNALKHGLYAKRFRAEEVKALRKMDPADFLAEIALLRVTIDRILDLVDSEYDRDVLAKLYGSLMNAVHLLNTTARTHAILNGKDSLVLEAIEEALTRFRDEEGIS